MSQSKVIVLEDNVQAVLKSVSGEALKRAAMAGGQVIEANAKINAGSVLNVKTGALRGSIQTVEGQCTETRAEAEVGPTVIYGRIHELGGIVLPVRAKMLSWLGASGERIFAKRVQIPARPYLRPAVDEHQDDIREAVGHQLKSGIEAATK